MVKVVGQKTETVEIEVSPKKIMESITNIAFDFINEDYRKREIVALKLKGKKESDFYMIRVHDGFYIDEGGFWVDPNSYFESDRRKREATEREKQIYNGLNSLSNVIWDIQRNEYEESKKK